MKNKAAQALGRLGGSKTSDAKKKATKKSLAKARKARWKVKKEKKVKPTQKQIDKDLFVRAKEAEKLGERLGRQYDADFRRLYMTEPIEAEFWSTPAKEPKCPFKKDLQPTEYEWWWVGYRETAYKWLTE